MNKDYLLTIKKNLVQFAKISRCSFHYTYLVRTSNKSLMRGHNRQTNKIKSRQFGAAVCCSSILCQ